MGRLARLRISSCERSGCGTSGSKSAIKVPIDVSDDSFGVGVKSVDGTDWDLVLNSMRSSAC